MSKLNDILRHHYIPGETLGGEGRIRDPDALRRELKKLLTHLRAMFWVAAAMIVAVFVVELAVGVTHLESPAILAGVAGAMGLTVAGAIEAMRRVAREMAQVNLLVILSAELDSEALAPIVNALVGKLQ
jgi:hypothetical protein